MQSPTIFPAISRLTAALLCLVLLATHAATAAAQGLPPGGLPAVPGLTALQKSVATVIQSVCITIQSPPYNTVATANGTSTQQLATSCNKMVASAYNNQGTAVPFANYGLNLTNAQIATGVQDIAPVQSNAQKQISSEAAKMNVIGARLLNVRGGSHGFELAMNGQDAQLAGGGAAADDAFGGRWGGFINVAYNWGSLDQTTLQDPYKYDSYNVLAGADYRVSDSLVLGGAVSYSNTKSRFDRALGQVNAATSGVVGYGSWYRGEWYVDGFVALGNVDYDSKRNINIPSNSAAPAATAINTTATSKPKGDQWSAAIGLGRSITSGKVSITPSARLGYISVINKAFSETEPNNGLALYVNERTVRSLQSAVGAKFSTVVNTSTAVFAPYFNAQWLHEFKNDNPSIVSKYVADPTNQFFAIPASDTTSNYAIVAVGSSVTFPNNVAGFFQFSSALGLKNESNYGVVLGLRKQF